MSIIFQKPPQNYLYSVGLCNLVNYRFDNVTSTAPVTNGVLHNNLVVPGRTLVQDGQMLTVVGMGNVGAHAGTVATLIVQINGNTVFTVGMPANAAAHGWEIWLHFIRNNSTQGGMWGKAFFNHVIGSTAIALSTFGARQFQNPFGGAGSSFDVDNTFQFLFTDAGGAEVMTQEISYIFVQ